MLQDGTACQFGMVGSGKRTGQVYQLLHPVITHAVVDIFATPFTLDKTTPAQALQVHRHSALRRADSADNRRLTWPYIVAESHISMICREIVKGGGSSGSASRVNQRASASSAVSIAISPPA